jgi:Asp-tRNA(Asn)/Glu-tRNA(Gln) amidotransferase A subunit family amidase
MTRSNRRTLERVLILGVAITVLLMSTVTVATSNEDEITSEMIAAAEALLGLEFSGADRLEIIDGLTEYREDYAQLRAFPFDESIVPSVVFNPIPAGMTFSNERKPFRYSDVEVVRPANLENAAFYTVPQLAKLLRTGQVTSTELTQMYLDRLKRYNATYLFAVTITEELALEQAAQADAEIQAGDYRGPLHGIPYGIKDLFSVAGYPTTWGAEPFAERILDRDASVVERLREAGAVLVAKLSTGRLATGEHWYGGTTRCAWNPTWGAGGSSAGPGSATAAGCVGFSIGTESAGSMISPCDVNGVTGLRPTFGRVSRIGMMTTSWSFDKVTPICRSVEGCAIVFNAIYGPDGVDNTIIDLPFNWDPDFDLRSLRIGYRTTFLEGELMPGDPADRLQIRRATQEAVDLFREAGFDLVSLDFGNRRIVHDPCSHAAGIMMMCENAAANDAIFRSDDMAALDRLDTSWPRYWKESHFIPAVEYIQASRCRTVVMEAMQDVMQDVDVYLEITWTSQWDTNLTGQPYVVVPAGFLSGGRPISVSFVGQLFGEAKLLAVAKWYQDATGYHLAHPEL